MSEKASCQGGKGGLGKSGRPSTNHKCGVGGLRTAVGKEGCLPGNPMTGKQATKEEDCQNSGKQEQPGTAEYLAAKPIRIRGPYGRSDAGCGMAIREESVSGGSLNWNTHYSPCVRII